MGWSRSKIDPRGARIQNPKKIQGLGLPFSLSRRDSLDHEVDFGDFEIHPSSFGSLARCSLTVEFARMRLNLDKSGSSVLLRTPKSVNASNPTKLLGADLKIGPWSMLRALTPRRR